MHALLFSPLSCLDVHALSAPAGQHTPLLNVTDVNTRLLKKKKKKKKR
jgi:hypothetical protein